MTRLFFNEYFERKEERLAERQDEKLFTLEKTDVNNFEFISVGEHLEIIEKRDKLLSQAKVLLCLPEKIKQTTDNRILLHQWLKDYDEEEN